MKDHHLNRSDAISALADGCLSAAESAKVIDGLLADDEALRSWHAYHVTGDVLRTADLAPATDDFAFLARLEQRLKLESGPDVVTLAEPQRILPDESANAAVFKWKLLAGVACLGLAGVIGLNLGMPLSKTGGEQMAVLPSATSSAPVITVADGAGAGMVRDPQLDALMAAHQQLGGHSALQAPAGFLRHAAYEGSRR